MGHPPAFKNEADRDLAHFKAFWRKHDCPSVKGRIEIKIGKDDVARYAVCSNLQMGLPPDAAERSRFLNHKGGFRAFIESRVRRAEMTLAA